jgi:hypothetical protein
MAELSREQIDYKTQQLVIGSEYEPMIKSKGWEFVQAWYQTQLASLINSMMGDDTRPIADFENARQQLIGFKKFLSHIEGAIKILNDERETNTGVTGEQ